MMADRLPKLIIRGTLVSKPNATHNLFCFPWAGGGAAQYIRWDKLFPPNIQVLAVRLPGRETRLAEPPYSSVDEFATDAAELIASDYRDKPFSFLGHSFGTRLALETAKKLREQYNVEPTVFFVSGAFSPGSERGNATLKERLPSELKEEDLIFYLRKIGGTPKEIIENPEMLKLILPPLRSDLRMLLNYSYTTPDQPPVRCPLVVMDGKEDIEHHLEEWRMTTTGETQITLFPGGHFFLLEPGVQQSVTKHIVNTLEELCPKTS